VVQVQSLAQTVALRKTVIGLKSVRFMQIFKYLFDLRAVTIDKILALSFPAEPTITYENGGYSPKQVLNVDETFRNGR
jgi:hypothetical protein